MMPAQRSSCATLQEKLLVLTFEPFTNLSPPFRELSPAVFCIMRPRAYISLNMGFWTIPIWVIVEVGGGGVAAGVGIVLSN